MRRSPINDWTDAVGHGTVIAIDPRTGQYYDDTKRYIDALPLSAGDKKKIFEDNARRVFPRLAKKLDAAAKQ